MDKLYCEDALDPHGVQSDLQQCACSAGGIPVLVVALDDNSHSVAMAAHQVILDVLDPTVLSSI